MVSYAIDVDFSEVKLEVAGQIDGEVSVQRLDAFDHQFFGIVSHEADYKISLEINKKLNISLANSEPATKDDNPGASFSRFTAKSRFNDLSGS